jgi:hypothetical protein
MSRYPGPEPAPTNLVPVLTALAPAPTKMEPVLYGSCLFGAGSDFFMNSIVSNAEIEMNPIINSVAEWLIGNGLLHYLSLIK